MKNIQITSSGIKKSLKKYSYSHSICEYIWNGFDAKATQIDISFTSNAHGAISELRIVDNGNGIFDSTRFQPFLEWHKQINPNAARTSSTIDKKKV